MVRLAALCLLLAGCASSQVRPETWRDCTLYTHNRWKVFACPDKWTGDYCKSKCPTADDGSPMDYYPRACTVWAKMPTIVIGKSFMGCEDHEICHVQNPDDPAMCEKKYPCMGKGK